MRTGFDSARGDGGLDPLTIALRHFVDEWRSGEPNLALHLAALPSDLAKMALPYMIKADIQSRFARGEPVSVVDYLKRFPSLLDEHERVISLVYEEYCLREEGGDTPDTEAFCDQYAPWKDSLLSQLRYHRVISQVVGPTGPPPRFPEPGDRFAEFQIRSVIGRGGAARVYLAEQTDMGDRQVALKVSADRGSEPSILGRLEHSHIIRVLTSARPPESRLLGLCMEYMPGLPLDEVIKVVNPAACPRSARVLRDALPLEKASLAPSSSAQNSTFENAEVKSQISGWIGFPSRGSYSDGVAWVIKTLAGALAYAHSRNVLHLDVKPANILLTAKGGPQLLDFNLSHDPYTAEHADAALRGGTLPYMAPEQLEAFLDPALWGLVTPAADIYSLGLLASELMTGRQPEAHDPKLPRARAIRGLLDQRRDLQLNLRRDNPSVPQALEAILSRCVAFQPADRYRSANELTEDLGLFLQRRPLKHSVNPSARERASFWLRRNLIAVMVTLGLAIGAATLVQMMHRGQAVDAAITNYEMNLNTEAHRAFEALGGPTGSPLVRFYFAATQARDGHELAVLGPMGELLRSESDSNALVSWGKDHSGFPGHLEDLSTILLGAADQKETPADFKPILIDQGEALAKLALRIDPRRDLARTDLATVEEKRGNFTRAYEILSSLVAEVESGTSPDARAKHWSHRLTRARSSTRIARSLSSLAKPDATQLDEAEAYANATFKDLDLLMKRYGPLIERLAFKLDYLRIEALLALSEIAQHRGHHELSVDFSRKARETCEKNSSFAKDNAYFRNLLESVDKRLINE